MGGKEGACEDRPSTKTPEDEDIRQGLVELSRDQVDELIGILS